MIRVLTVLLLLALPAAAFAAPGDPDRDFGRRGTVTLKATDTDAVGYAVKVLSGNRVLAGGTAAGQLVLVKLRASGSLDSAFGTRGQVVPALPGTSLDGVKGIQTVRDGRIVASGTLRLADGTTRFVTLRLLPSGEIDPSFGAGLGYVLGGPIDAQLQHDGHGPRRRRLPRRRARRRAVLTQAPAGRHARRGFAAAGFGLAGRVTGLLLRTDGTITYTVAAGPARSPSSGSCATGAPDPTWRRHRASSTSRSARARRPASAPSPCARARRTRRSSPART